MNLRRFDDTLIAIGSSLKLQLVAVLLVLRQCANIYKHAFFSATLRLNAGHGLLILEVSKSHTKTQHSR